jgi:Sigma-70 region 2
LSHRPEFIRHRYDGWEHLNVTEAWLVDGFETHRRHMRAVAYRMLGSLSDAEDAVQEAWLRASRSAASGVENLGGWLTTIVARVSLDMLRSRESRREAPLDSEPSRAAAGSAIDPEEEAVLADSSRPFLPPRAQATSRGCSPSSIPTWCGAPTRRRPAARHASCAARRRWPGERSQDRNDRGRPWSRSCSLTAGSESWSRRAGVSMAIAFGIRDRKIVAIDVIADAAALRGLELGMIPTWGRADARVWPPSAPVGGSHHRHLQTLPLTGIEAKLRS